MNDKVRNVIKEATEDINDRILSDEEYVVACDEISCYWEACAAAKREEMEKG